MRWLKDGVNIPVGEIDIVATWTFPVPRTRFRSPWTPCPSWHPTRGSILSSSTSTAHHSTHSGPHSSMHRTNWTILSGGHWNHRRHWSCVGRSHCFTYIAFSSATVIQISTISTIPLPASPPNKFRLLRHLNKKFKFFYYQKAN